MKRAVLVATGLLAISTTATAGGYLGLGLGAQPGVNDQMAMSTPPVGRSLRGLAGLRLGKLSLEGAINGFDVIARGAERPLYQLSGALKLNLPLGDNFEAFGRAGLERTWLDVDDARYNLTGDGFLAGGGFEYRLDAILASASLFVDYTVHHATLEDARNNKLDEISRIWALGFTIGI
jgi:Outer membrane protein beta-barrel domain